MPCNCDHLEPSMKEIESKKIMLLLEEVDLHKGEIPYYGMTANLDRDTNQLCDFCHSNDVSKFSLELQIWWRDHQRADKERLEREQQKAKKTKEKKEALKKLTTYERNLLNI